jgi:FkbM family methyltransferase
MHSNFTKFLDSLAADDLHTAYLALHQDFTDSSEKKIAEQLIKICTSHFFRQRSSKLNSLINLKKTGFNPAIVFDVGAQVGTPELYTAFPDAHHVFIEPVVECVPTLNAIAAQLKSALVINCAVSDTNGTTSLSVTSSKQYSSIDASSMNGNQEIREINVRTVDSIYKDINISGPILLKIDVDGIEIKVLKGSLEVLKNDCVVVIEASIADENPRFNNVVETLSNCGYQVFDIVDPLHRMSDWHLWQVDLVFVKKGSDLWGGHKYP